KSEPTWIAIVEQDQVHHGFPLWHRQIPPAVSHYTVGNFKDGFQDFHSVFAQTDRTLSQGHDIAASFDAPPHVQELPAMTTRHICHFHSSQSRQVDEQAVELFECIGRLWTAAPSLRADLEVLENTPGVGRESFTQGKSRAAQAIAQLADGAQSMRLENQLVNLPLNCRQTLASSQRRRKQVQPNHQFNQACQLGTLSTAGFPGEAT